MPPIRWSNIAVLCGLLVTATAFAVWGPVWKHEHELREAFRRDVLAEAIRLDAAGLSPCRDGLRETVEQAFPERGPEPEFSMVEFPSLRGWPWQVRLDGNLITVVELEGAQVYPPPPPPPGFGPGDYTMPPLPPVNRLEGRSVLDRDQAQVIAKLFRERIGGASAEFQSGADGALYVLQSHGSCAYTWSPNAASGGGRLVLMAQLMALQASLAHPESEQRIAAALPILQASFEHGDGSEIVDRKRGEPRESWLSLGPRWTPAARARSVRISR